MKNLVTKIEKAHLVGRGGTEFPVAKKWQSVLDAPGDEKFVICNASEGEPGVRKDWQLLAGHLTQVCDGIMLACKLIGAKKCWINCNHDYFEILKPQLAKQVTRLAQKDVELILFREKEDSYLGGESSTMMNAIEGKKQIPRSKKFHATEQGLWGKPTLINNVETFFDVAAVANGTFDNTRLYTISGAIPNPGVFRLSTTVTAREVLEQTGNSFNEKSLIQIGGSACGPVWRGKSLDQPVTGAGSLEVYDATITPQELLTRWLTFFHSQLCGTCTPCRDGTFQLLQLINQKTLPWNEILEITELQQKTALCGLGRSIDTPVRSLYERLHEKN
jgi:NADH:ubiquinone oxidoreductase subunit F (NADH-binding)